MKNILFLLICAIFFTFCTSSLPEVNFDELDESAKRLPEMAIHGMETAEGTEVTLFAHEPMLINPTNLHVDEYGRVWVCEALNYRNGHNPENPVREQGDRILILEDTDEDGKADKSTVFYQGTDINAALGIWALNNQAIVSCSPNVLLLTDTDGDDVADLKDTLFTGLGGLQTDHAVHAFVLGPDGRYYFNFGNTGGQILDKYGQPVTDPTGRPVTDQGKPYRQGMVFRCNPDGSGLEVLGHNFRNNYEVAVDSYGTLWQSDNDDDGNRGVRINYIMEYGNYGYVDEMTGAGWQEDRINMEKEIPLRHWHLNDPGVVPNLLQTGSGSPCGIAIYEGNMLPAVFQGQMLHAEAGHNVVRAYPVEADGAGYRAKIVDLLKSKDQWFRPSDVCVAPDGSVFISDWYDPAVGGHKFGDPERGRIYRVTAKGKGRRYDPGSYSFTDPEAAAEALKNPNLAVRSRAREVIPVMGEAGQAALKKLWNNDDQRLRARALWLLAGNEEKSTFWIEKALADPNPDLRITALRLARQVSSSQLPAYLTQLVTDPSPAVRREAAIALHRMDSSLADSCWARLALQYDGKDRWYLEALGIGADNYSDSRFAVWRAMADDQWKKGAGRDIVWRSRSAAALPLLQEMVLDTAVTSFELRQYLRAFDFHTATGKNDRLASLLDQEHPLADSINRFAIYQMDADFVKRNPRVMKEVRKILPSLQGGRAYLDMVEKLELKDQGLELLRMVLESKAPPLRMKAAILLAQSGGLDLLLREFRGAGEDKAKRLLSAMGPVGDPQLYAFYQKQFMDERNSMTVRRAALNSLEATSDGQIYLMELLDRKEVPPVLTNQALLALSNAWNMEVRQKSRAMLAEIQEAEGEELPPLAILETRSGEATHGKRIFDAFCANCHMVGEEGSPFGPALTEIGSKLGKNGLYQAILYPSTGISFGYEGYTLHLKDGSTLTGIIESRTAKETTLRLIGGVTRKVSTEQVDSTEELPQSLMTEGLHKAFSQEDLVNLVEYLASLKAEAEW